jgi:hypothetical protein
VIAATFGGIFLTSRVKSRTPRVISSPFLKNFVTFGLAARRFKNRGGPSRPCSAASGVWRGTSRMKRDA